MRAGAILLSGGKSSRMGTNKALLPFNEQTNIERISQELKSMFDEIILVTNDPDSYEFLNIRMVSDIYPGKGPLAGIHAGLIASDYEENIVVACDMPFVSAELAANLVKNLKHYDALVPFIGGRRHPLMAAYQKRIIPEIELSIKEDRLKMLFLFDKLNVRFVDEEELQSLTDVHFDKVFYNMNYPDEYEHAKKWIEKGE
ncbi:molybdenum cofactor guanylyltransferase [Bacillus sp. B15-48]|uniref:molybdenum cofactor guanylyltransferase n=1 Tax=Bacillus sp. B15-48 TaxID=1548601 RepID=UPI00193F42D6|nr:molybdenum cofactor guanylyltransferase [Bacillus sp. B15-48]MBM4761603.1 NTP transferase domain-containing protein [Bacillus sp. B15-48]